MERGERRINMRIKNLGKLLLIVLLSLLIPACKASKNDIIESEDSHQKQKGISYKYIDFDDITPKGLKLLQCWDAMGMDDKERVYIGWTSRREDGREDFAVFRYDNGTGEKQFLGTFMNASEAAGNLKPDEQIPKGHTKMIFIKGKMYMASQSFHDFKNGIEELPKYRGSHIYAYDIEKDELEDISAGLTDGVITKNQGIVALTYMEETNMILGLTHPHSDIVMFNIKDNRVEKVISGIPWSLGNPLSREIVVGKDGKIYTYRGTEDPALREKEYNMWVYDTKTDEMKKTDYKASGGFWNGQAASHNDGKIYLSTVNGDLYMLNTEKGKLEYLTHFLPEEEVKMGKKITYMYSITLSKDGKKIYGIPSVNNGNLYQYSIDSKKVSMVKEIENAIFTGSNIKDSKGNLYFAKFAPWEGKCRLLVVDTNN